MRELELLHVANARIQELDCAEEFAASELKYLVLLLQPGLYVVYSMRSAYEGGWAAGADCAASLPWWVMGTGFVGCLLLVVFCAFATGRVPFDERAYTCACCCVPYTGLLAGGWVALSRSDPSCGPALFYLCFGFGLAYCAYFGLLILTIPCFLLWCQTRGGGPFRGLPLYFVVVFAPLHLLMPGVPVMPLAYLWRGPRRGRRRTASDDDAQVRAEDAPHDDDAEAPAPLAEVSEVELLTPRSVRPTSSRGARTTGAWGDRPKRAASGPVTRV